MHTQAPANCRFDVVCSRCASSCQDMPPTVEVINSTSIPTCQPVRGFTTFARWVCSRASLKSCLDVRGCKVDNNQVLFITCSFVSKDSRSPHFLTCGGFSADKWKLILVQQKLLNPNPPSSYVMYFFGAKRRP